MTVRPRCPRGHFLPRTGTCRCTHRPLNPDLYGQRRRIEYRDLETIPLTGNYL